MKIICTVCSNHHLVRSWDSKFRHISRLLASSTSLSPQQASSSTTHKPRVIIVGGGAAGFFSAIECAQLLSKHFDQYEVLVLEAGTKVLQKVCISGGGRCNVMHDPSKGADNIAKGYPRGFRELLGPLHKRFGPWDAFDWFTQQGVQLKTEADGRVFPVSDKSSTVVSALTTAAAEAGVAVKCGVRVTGVEHIAVPRSSSAGAGNGENDTPRAQLLNDGHCYYLVSIATRSRSANSSAAVIETNKLECDRVILATGSARVGYDILLGLGHSIAGPLPSLFSFQIQDCNLTELSGISTPAAEVKLLLPSLVSKSKSADKADKAVLRGLHRELAAASGKLQQNPLQQQGPMLITKQGLSGPAVLKLSAYGAKVAAALGYRFNIEVNWLAGVSCEELLLHLRQEKEEHPNRSVGKYFPSLPLELAQSVTTGNAALESSTETSIDSSVEKAIESGALIPRRLWLYFLQRAGVEAELRWKAVNDAAMTRIAQQITSGVFQVNGRGVYRDEFVTCGGVPLKELDFSRMESRCCRGLYLAGEVLDVDGITGGYNFQSAWTTAHIAGTSCANSFLPSC